jgi:hypothetical protein
MPNIGRRTEYYMPVPDRLMVCGLSRALSVIVTAPARVPVVVGANLMLIWQLDPIARDDLQVVVRVKLPLMAVLMLLSAAVPVFVKVTVCAALVVPTVCAANVRLVVERLAMGAVPVPERVTVCGLVVALSVIVIVPGWLPAAVGVNVTLMEQLAPAAREAAQLLVWAYSALATMLVMVRGAVPELVSVTDFAALVVFTKRLAKAKVVGDKLTPGAVPVPERGTV